MIPTNFDLSPVDINEGLKGRWYKEFDDSDTDHKRKIMRWSSFDNNKSFWIQREELIGLIYDLGFNTVFEQFDSFAPGISSKLQDGYKSKVRGTFVGIKNL